MNSHNLYIGQYSEGTTSRLRADQLEHLLTPGHFGVVDTNIPFYSLSRVWRSIGFRFKRGPLIKCINDYIISNLPEREYDLIWIDKAIFLKKETLLHLKGISKCLIHYTPDMAFYSNRSRHFSRNMGLFDYLITTKTKEITIYKNRVPENKILISSQGFSSDIHKPYHDFKEKDNAAVFIGLGEQSRYHLVDFLLKNNIKVKLVGKKWKKFVRKHKDNAYLEFIGESIFGIAYGELISSSMFALGLLSKNFPELHTTRTFEIPACGTALLTESNEELKSFFQEEEVIFYSSGQELVDKIKYYQAHPNQLEILTQKGYERVLQDGYDYESLLRKVLEQIDVKNN